MNQSDLSAHLTRLSEYKIGLHEAAMLFAIDGETSNEALALALDLDRQAIWSRTKVLRSKGFITTSHRPTGGLYHKLTKRGRELIARVLQES